MDLVLISTSRGARGHLRIGWSTVAVALLGCTALILGVGYWGFCRGADYMANAVRTDPENAANFWQREIIAQRLLLNDIRIEAQADLSALAGKIGSIESHVIRLDAAAGRLMSAADLDPLEFDFDDAPPIGGPTPAGTASPSWGSLVTNVEALSREIEIREERFSALEALLQGQRRQHDTQPAGEPLAHGWMSSGYGYRTDPVTGMREFHAGIDFGGRLGKEVRSVAAGVVTWSGKRWGYGNMVEINHGNGYVTRYAHNRKNLVSVGDRVSKHQAIALLGSSGRSTGPHVHFEVLNDDKLVNPWPFVQESAAN